MNNIGKILIVIALIVVVGLVIILKNQPTPGEQVATESSDLEKLAVPSDSTNDEIANEGDTIKKNADTYSQEIRSERNSEKSNSDLERVTETEKTDLPERKKASGDVLAIVGDEEITKKELETEYNKLSPQYKDMFKNDKDLYLEQLIIKEILVQKAIEKGFIKSENPSQSQQDNGIQKLIDELGKNIEISDGELEKFYQENKDQMQGASFEEMKNNIRNYLRQQKQNEEFENYLDEIRNEAEVVLNEDWMAQQLAAKPKNPLTDALKNGLPTVLDLGSDSCIPCQMMMPIFDELKQELAGKANVILLQIAEYRNLANEYKVRVIPTQIFFDQNGKQYWRHEGFLSKEDIIKKLKETGAQL